MAPRFDICIRGSGILGKTLALLLARERLAVALLAGAQDAQDDAQADVRAYALNLASRRLLESLRSWPDAAQATAVRRMEILGDRGGAVHFDAAAQSLDALAWIVDTPALDAALAQALRFQPLVEVVAAPVPAPLTVLCEGRSSSSRAALGVDFQARPYEQHAIATRLRCEVAHAQVARQWFVRNGGILAFLPMQGAAGDCVAVVCSVAQQQAESLMELSAEAFAQELHAMSQGALGALTLCAERRAWPLQRALADRWCGAAPADWGAGNQPCSWALAGDAAHTVHPLSGQGLNLGLADAQALTNGLRQREPWRGLADLRWLRRYERERKAAMLAIGLVTDGLQQLFARPAKPWQALRNRGMQGFDRSGPIKNFIARQAMGMH